MIVLDIGSGSKEFGKKLRSLNPQLSSVLCGEPFWKQKRDLKYEKNKVRTYLANIRADLLKVLSEKEVEEVLTGTKKGVHRIVSRYEKIELPDNSLDVVTLNSPHPMMYPWTKFFNEELIRVLKPGGIFYFGHSSNISIPSEGGFSSNFDLIGRGIFDFRKGILKGEIGGLVFPISPVIYYNAKVLFWREFNQKHGYPVSSSPGYLYNPRQLPLIPNWKAWVKK